MYLSRRAILHISILTLSLAPQLSTAGHAATDSEIQQWLDSHNSKRQLHQVGPVTWSATVAASAQNYANTCPDGHSSSGYGENLAWASYPASIETVVSWWYSEESKYDYANPGWQPEAGHFTQMVWKGTTEIGCGMALCSSGDWSHVWVCQYNPPGNVIGAFAENVFPPLAQNAAPQQSPQQQSVLSHLFMLLR